MERLIQRYPVLSATTLYSIVVSAAFWRFFRGEFLINRMSDQWTGYSFRQFAAQHFREHGSIPEWSPYIFGGMPFIANTGHGDTFYPTFLLRLLLPVDVGMSLGFLIHLVLAGTFMFVFLRGIGLGWVGSFVGGGAYLMSGQIVSLVSPGHDGKLFVSAFLPLALLFLYRAVTTGMWRQYLYFGAVVGLALITPHFQMVYYLLMAAGFFWLYLVFLHDPGNRPEPWWRSALLFGGGLVFGFALAAIQLLPFIEYIQFSPRGAGGGASVGWDYAVSWSMPPEELINVVWPAFSGILEHYWGRNPFKLHGEYLGAAALVVATFAFVGKGGTGHRIRWFFVFLAGYGVLFALGGHTPFYHLPYNVLPGISLTRAPSMIFFIVSFATAALAALGTERLVRREAVSRTPFFWWGGVAAAAVLFAFIGGWRGVMDAFVLPERAGAVPVAYDPFTVDTLRVLVFVGLAAGLVWMVIGSRIRSVAVGFALGAVVLLDLWSAGRHFIRFSPPAEVTFAADEVVQAVRTDGRLFRVLPVGAYGENYLMAHGVRSILGYHGNELHRYDELLGGKNVWRMLGNPNVWDVLAVRYLVAHQPIQAEFLEPVMEGVVTSHERQPTYLYRVRDAAPFAWLVREALKLPDEQILPVLWDQRFDPRRMVLVPDYSPHGRSDSELEGMPEPVEFGVVAEEPRAGLLRFRLDEPAPEPMYLFVSENYYPSWHARVDGEEVPVLRAQFSLMAVPVAPGAREVEFFFRSRAYRHGRLLTMATALVLVGLLVTARRERGEA